MIIFHKFFENFLTTFQKIFDSFMVTITIMVLVINGLLHTENTRTLVFFRDLITFGSYVKTTARIVLPYGPHSWLIRAKDGPRVNQSKCAFVPGHTVRSYTGIQY